MLFHCKPVNQQKTSIFALILWEEQRLNRFWSEKRCRNSTFTCRPPKSVYLSLFQTQEISLLLDIWLYFVVYLVYLSTSGCCLFIVICMVVHQVSGHLGTWTSRYSILDISVLKISVLNNKNNLIEFKNFLNNCFTCRRCLYKFLCFFFNHL